MHIIYLLLVVFYLIMNLLLRGIEFVTRKITYQIALIKHGLDDKIVLGNIDSKRDWGFAKDYVDCMWRMLQKDEPKDYVVATGVNYSIRDFVEKAFAYAGLDLNKYLRISKLYRPTDVDTLLGDPNEAVKDLNWDSKLYFNR